MNSVDWIKSPVSGLFGNLLINDFNRVWRSEGISLMSDINGVGFVCVYI